MQFCCKKLSVYLINSLTFIPVLEGYNVIVHGQKSYNGVAILTKIPQEDTIFGIPGFNHELAPEARYMESTVVINSIVVKLISVYVPNGMEIGSDKFSFKLSFLSALKERMSYLISQGENLVVCGDMNVALDDMDVYDSSYMQGKLSFSIEERKALRSVISSGLYDSFRIKHPTLKKFTWWDYRRNSFNHDKGLRIDYIMLSSGMCDKLQKCDVKTEARTWERPSDHAPMICEFSFC